MVVDREVRQDGRVQYGQHKIALFCTYDDMVASSDPGWLQGGLNTLVGLFDQVGLQMNVKKMVGMVCHTCEAAGTQLESAY